MLYLYVNPSQCFACSKFMAPLAPILATNFRNGISGIELSGARSLYPNQNLPTTSNAGRQPMLTRSYDEQLAGTSFDL
jgi:hypothetical protein